MYSNNKNDHTFAIIGNIHIKYNEQRGHETHTLKTTHLSQCSLIRV